ncbi:uncharacterized protein CIMG_11569 [Coccidioides immitis RS]|uniref:Uncharacterized protein n=1 Tax=Coccidioides immitis (strain RS) TaxID=246410 RepID=A0A0D8JW99_COCIM|nr:uncharacterized protein CIMG_11569 [Coccidioides immitis RS]KJF61191.1 hypothetical protein CIMG_11569 [Coccidioides immitis RS]
MAGAQEEKKKVTINTRLRRSEGRVRRAGRQLSISLSGTVRVRSSASCMRCEGRAVAEHGRGLYGAHPSAAVSTSTQAGRTRGCVESRFRDWAMLAKRGVARSIRPCLRVLPTSEWVGASNRSRSTCDASGFAFSALFRHRSG